MNRSTIFLLAVLLSTQATKAQDYFGLEQTSAGVGVGMDYGGLGFNIHHYLTPGIAAFGGIGFAMTGVGYNAGIKTRFFTKDRIYGVFPFLQAMYGYHAVVMVENASQYDKIFFGPTLGVGLDIRPKPKSRFCWNIGMMIPLRGSTVDDYMNDLEQNHGVVFENELPPVGLSFGLRWIINAFPEVSKVPEGK